MVWFLSQSLNFSMFALLYVYLYLATVNTDGSHLTDNPGTSKTSNNCHTELVIHISTSEENGESIKEDYNQVVCDDNQPKTVYYSYP